MKVDCRWPWLRPAGLLELLLLLLLLLWSVLLLALSAGAVELGGAGLPAGFAGDMLDTRMLSNTSTALVKDSSLHAHMRHPPRQSKHFDQHQATVAHNAASHTS
jgi:hypothetical protein